jgi:hypothetical protein
MSEVRVNKLSPRSGTTVTLGDSGDTITIPSGVTFDASSGGLAGTLTTAAQPNITSVGTLTSFTSTGIDDNASSTAMTISSSGVVSIGTTSSSGGWSVKVAGSNAPLELARTAGDTVERSQLGMEREGTFVGQFKSDATNLWLEASTGALIINTGGGTERMRIDSSGNVGIGNTVASTINSANGTGNLVVGSGSGTEGITIYSGTTGEGTLQFADASTGAGTYVGQINYNHSNNFMSFGANGSERMRIDSSGNVGIGETAPLGKLHIKSADSGGTPNSQYDELVLEQNGNNCGMTILCNSPGDGAIYFGDSADNDIGGIAYSHFDNKMFFKVNGSERMRIRSDGAVHIGTANNAATDFKYHTSYTDGNVARFHNNTATNPYGIAIDFDAASPDDNSRYFLFCTDSSAIRLRIDSDGDVKNHDNSYGAISDERIKQDIRDSNSQWNDIKAVRVRNFKKKDDVRQYGEDAWEQIGVIAQELETVSPRLIKHSDPTPSDILSDASFGTLYQEGDEIPEGKKIGDVKEVHQQVKGVSYSVLYMKSIKALQEAMNRIETLEAKVQTLENN